MSARSTLDLRAATELAHVFVATRPYARALDVLERHRFAVLTGPPEMGKTAIARTVALARMVEGWEAHECASPHELWSRFDRDRPWIFIADDAFGSTEYRPESAERWARELDRILRAMDERHWLLWTSRPAPLRAGLRRVHRERGAERFPSPAEVQIDASGLDVAEKALILFRHAKAARLEPELHPARPGAWARDRLAPALHPRAHPALRRRAASGPGRLAGAPAQGLDGRGRRDCAEHAHRGDGGLLRRARARISCLRRGLDSSRASSSMA